MIRAAHIGCAWQECDLVVSRPATDFQPHCDMEALGSN